MTPSASNASGWQCSSCRRTSPQTEFCSACGARLGIHCLNCHALTALSQRFCHQCGQEKEKVYRQQQAEAKAQMQHVIELTRKEIRQFQLDLTLPVILLKGGFSKGYSCVRAIGGFLIFFAFMTYSMAQSFQSTMRPSAIADAQVQWKIALALGLAFFTIPAALSFAAQKRRLLREHQERLPDLAARVQSIESTGFVDWSTRVHQHWVENNRAQAGRRRAEFERDERRSNEISDEAYQDWLDRQRQWEREYDAKEREKEEQRRADEEYWDRRADEERRQREEDDYQREKEEKEQRERDDDW